MTQAPALGPLLFSLALSPIVEEIQALGPRLNLWYLDDGVIVGPPSLFWDIIRMKGPSLGLFPMLPSASSFGWIPFVCLPAASVLGPLLLLFQRPLFLTSLF